MRLDVDPERATLLAVAATAVITLVGVALATWGALAVWVQALAAVALCGIVLAALLATAVHAVRRDRWSAVPVAVSALLAIYLGAFHNFTGVEPYWSMRDQVVYLVSAQHASASGGLAFHMPHALSYLGFDGIGGPEVTPHFLPGYIIFLAFFLGLWESAGLALAFSVLACLTVLVVYCVGRRLQGGQSGALAVALVVLSFAFLWFQRGTWSENMEVLLLWGAVLAILAVRTTPVLAAVTWGLCAGTLLLLRAEGIAFLLSSAAVAIAVAFREPARGRLGAIAAAALVVPVGVSLLHRQAFGSRYLERIAAAEAPLAAVPRQFAAWLWGVLRGSGAEADPLLVHLAHYQHYEWDVFVQYGIVLLAAIACAWLASRRRGQELAIVAVVAPAAFFLFAPSISADQPWFLRRFYPTLFVCIGILAAAALSRLALLRDRKAWRGAAWLVSACVVMAGLVPSWGMATGREMASVPSELESLGEGLRALGASENDVFLLQRQVMRFAPALSVATGWYALQDRENLTRQALTAIYASDPEAADGRVWVLRDVPIGATEVITEFPDRTWRLEWSTNLTFTMLERSAVVPLDVFADSANHSYEEWVADLHNVPPSTWVERRIPVLVYGSVD